MGEVIGIGIREEALVETLKRAKDPENTYDVWSYLQTVAEFIQHPQAKYAMYSEAATIAKNISSQVDGVSLIFGSGHPFIVMDMDDPSIPEMERYYLKVLGKKAKAANAAAGLLCHPCLEDHQPVLNFADLCKHCSSPIKPIDIVRGLKDLDIIVILDSVTPAKLLQIETFLQENNTSPNIDLVGTLRKSEQFMKSVIQGGRVHEGKLFIDLVVTYTATIANSFASIGSGDLVHGHITYKTLRSGVWVDCHDELPEDIFMSGPYPLYTPDRELLRYIQHCVSGYSRTAEPEVVMSKYLEYLETYTDKKYSRMMNSSGLLRSAVFERILHARTGSIYTYSTVYE